MKEEEIINQDVIYYRRDEKGKLIGIKYDNNEYYYIKNLQEDIIGITDSNNNLLCSYVYDSWGKILSIKDNEGNDITDTSHIGLINPFRYRSYYYDEEIGLYYLNSRYYNPEWGRFINADGLINFQNVVNYNLYLYTENNYVVFNDYNGNIYTSILNFFQKVSQNVIDVLKIAKKKTNLNRNVTKSENKNKMPTIDKPNSRRTNPNGDTRIYGPDGKALKDIDKSHPQHHPELENPHIHDWGWDGEKPNRKAPRNPYSNEKLFKGALTFGVGYVIYRGIRMIPSLFPGFWWTAPINLATP